MSEMKDTSSQVLLNPTVKFEAFSFRAR